MAQPNVLDTVYSYAWFVTFALSFVAYLALMRGAPAEAPATRRAPQPAHW